MIFIIILLVQVFTRSKKKRKKQNKTHHIRISATLYIVCTNLQRKRNQPLQTEPALELSITPPQYYSHLFITLNLLCLFLRVHVTKSALVVVDQFIHLRQFTAPQ